jgi:protein SCO1/2
VSLEFNTQQRPGTGALAALAFACLIVSGACGPSRGAKQTNSNLAGNAQPATAKRYPLTGRVVSVDKAIQSINVDGDEIPGFMAAMTMPYQVKDASVLDKVAPGDRIKAEIVVGNEGAYLENVVVVTRTASQTPAK